MKHRYTVGAAVLAAACFPIARRRHLRWGATDEELRAALPGDELIPHADLSATRAIAIGAPADEVWPWIAQLGQGRGGFYSYDGLENLFGCDIHSADRIVAEWQDVEIGDEVMLFEGAGLVVSSVVPGRSLVLHGAPAMGRVASPYDFTWAFVVDDAADGTSRLVVRERYAYRRAWAPLLVEPTEAVSFVMSRRMLRGIRDRAQEARSPTVSAGPA
jgi:hypothetical protein